MREGWKTARMSEVFELQMGKTPSRDNPNYWGGPCVWVAIGDMNSAKYISDSKEHISSTAVTESGIKQVPSGCVIMSFKLSVGKVAVTSVPLFTNEAIMAFKVRDGYELLPDYIYYYLKGYKWDGVNRAAMGLTLNKASISQGKFSYPKIIEQERIVAELDLLTGIIDKQKQQLKELDTLAQSIFYDMFGDPVENEKGWTLSTIEKVCSSIVRGPFGSALRKEFFVEKSDTSYKVYEQKHAIQKNANIGSYYISEDKFQSLRRFEVYCGDIIMSCSGTIGELFEIPMGSEKGVMNQALLKFTLNETINKLYFIYLMDFVKDSFEKKGTGLQNIGSVGTIKATRIALPPIQIQQSFAQKIQSIESQKASINRSIAETRKLFDYTMDKYFG